MNTKYLDIIKAPVVTEKSTNGKNLNQYTSFLKYHFLL